VWAAAPNRYAGQALHCIGRTTDIEPGLMATSSETPAKRSEGRRRIGLVGWLWRMGLAVLILLVGLAGTGLIFQAVATRNDQQKFPAPGELVDVGGYQLHLNCIGNGTPTIILDALGNGSSASWGLVQPEIAQSNRVCAYDRAGAGWSERGPAPRDMNQHVRELHALLAGARVGGPYVLVGHSYGGRIARVYAKTYPREVFGMVLIDPGRLDDDPRFPPQHHKERAAERRLITVARWLAPFGVVRLFQPRLEYYDLPAQQAVASDSFAVTTTYCRLLLDHGRAMPQTLAQEREVTSLSSMPLIVVSATAPDDETRRVWTEINGELAALSINGVHRVVPGATHESLVWKSADAQVTIDSIRQVLDAARTGQPLVTR
jgi:pimeloyl-ACP methyl ester carboxylesterase